MLPPDTVTQKDWALVITSHNILHKVLFYTLYGMRIFVSKCVKARIRMKDSGLPAYPKRNNSAGSCISNESINVAADSHLLSIASPNHRFHPVSSSQSISNVPKDLLILFI